MGNSLWLFAWWLITLSVPTSVRSVNLPWQEILFPKNPVLKRVKSLSEAREYGGLAVLHFTAMVEQHGYPAEEHNFTTDDGYHISLHRIPGSPLSSSRNKPVVYLQHGMLASSDTWVLVGPRRDFAFLLADAGYDVWLGNIRGNTYCRSHERLSTDDREFWRFSFDEFACQDLRMAIDYVLKVTGRRNLQYVGHSMGTTILYILLSSMPDYNEKINLGVSLAPVAFWRHKLNSLFSQIVKASAEIKNVLDSAGIYDVASQNLVTALLGEKFCSDYSVSQPLCIHALNIVSGPDPDQLNTTFLPHMLKYVPAGVSTQTLSHYAQNIISGKFASYDHGPEENMNRYNQRTPPSYNLDAVTAPIALFSGPNDALIKKEDVMELRRRLRSVVYAEDVPYKLFSHLDFLFAIQAKEILYDRLIELMVKYRD